MEGAPAVVLGIVVLACLPNGPGEARWLASAERAWLESRLAEEAALLERHRQHRLADAFTSGRVWLLCLLYFLLNVGGYGYEMWLPTIVKEFSGASNATVGLLNAVPYLAAAIVMLLVGRYSDRTGHRRWPVALGAVASAAGFALSAWLRNPYLAMAALVLAFAGLKSTLGPFWALGTASLGGTAAAGGIALINSVGNLGGFVGPYAVGVIKDQTGSHLAALMTLGGALLTMGLLALTLRGASPRAVRPD